MNNNHHINLTRRTSIAMSTADRPLAGPLSTYSTRKRLLAGILAAILPISSATPVYAGAGGRATAGMEAVRATSAAAPGALLTQEAPSAGTVRKRVFVPKFQRRDATPRDAGKGGGAAAVMRATGGTAAAATALPDAPSAADLAETEDVTLTPAIRALAAALGNHPVRILNWVQNNVEYVPTFGSLQGAEMALQTRRANDIDTASLLIALYRAAGIPARYGRGTMEIPAARAANWLGATGTAEASLALLAQGGVPASGVVQGGSVGALRIDHTWVEAFVDVNPSRGAVNRTPNTWVAVDGSYKQSTYTPGLDVATGVNANIAGYLAQLQQGATLNAGEGSVSRFNRLAASTSYTAFQNGVAGYIAAQKPAATVGDVLGAAAIVAQNHPILAGSLPYKTVGTSTRFAGLPDALRWKFRYAVYATEADRAADNALARVQRGLLALAGKRISLGFVPASATDAGNLNAAVRNAPLPSALPGYQYRLKAQLKLDGQLAGEGGNLPLGTVLTAVSAVYDPGQGTWQSAAPHQPAVGETLALAVAPQGVSAEQLAASRDRLTATKAKLDARDYTGLTGEDVTTEPLYYAALGFIATAESQTRLMRRAFNVIGASLPIVVRTATRNDTTFVNGVPQSVRFAGVALDVDTWTQSAVATAGGAGAVRGLLRATGERASALSPLLLEKLFMDSQHTGEGSSAIKALMRANEGGQKLFAINAASASSALAQVNAATDVKSALEAGLAAGKQGLVHESPLTFGTWSGSGYVIEDTATGAGSYELNGQITAAVQPLGGWSALALGSAVLDAGNGAALTAELSPLLSQTTGSYAALAALLGDVRNVAWSNFAGAPAYHAGLWMAAAEPLAVSQLGNGFGSLAMALAAGSLSALPGTPVNNAPLITSTAVTAAVVGQPYQYLVSAIDAESDPITYSLPTAPAGMTISAGGLITWAAPVRGTHSVVVRASDGRAAGEQRFLLTVSDVLPLTLSLQISPRYAAAGDSVAFSVATVGGRGTVNRSLTVDGQPLPLDGNGQARLANVAAGAHQAVATATDSDGSVIQRLGFGARDGSDTVPPVVEIKSPAMGAELKGPIDIIGTATDANLVEWQLLLSPAGQARYTVIAQGSTSVTGAVLGKFDPTQLLNGQWDVLLRAVDASGQESSVRYTYEVKGEMKVGQFSVAFLDLSLDAAGIPVSVTRSYDTRRRNESLDFGYGWTVDYQSVRVEKNLTPGIGWQVYPQGLLNVCIRPIGKRTISIALPDGKLHRFDVGANPQCAAGGAPASFAASFTPRGDTTSTLADVDAGPLLIQGDKIYDLDGQPYNPTRFTLTTLEGYVYTLDQGFGIRSVKEPNGNTVTFGANGLVHSAGASIAFTRDAQGRIVKVTDPAGKWLSYTYDDAGDLISVTDRTGGVSRMTYNGSHGLLTFTDPRGIQLAKNEYDADGRLIAQYDASGAKLDLAGRDIPGKRETVKDRRGNATVYEYDDAGNVTTVTDAKGGVTRYTYDAEGNELTKTDANGHTVTRTVDVATSTVLTEKDPLGNTTTYGYNTLPGPNGPMPSTIASLKDAKGNVTSFGYDPLGNPTGIKDATGATTGMGWSNGNLTRLTDAAGNATAYAYDAKGNRTQETDALGNVTNYTYDANGKVTGTTRTRVVNGVTQTLTTSRTLDADGNPLTEKDALGNVTQTSYNALKKVATTTDAANRVTRHDYDDRGYLIRTIYPDGTSEGAAFDANGNQTGSTDAAGRVTATEYDALNRPTKITAPDGGNTSSTYDAGGRVIATTDERGNTTTNEYDAAGRRTKVTDALGNVTRTAYDANGNVTTLTDASGNVTTFEYDAANRRTRTTYAPVDGAASNTSVGYDAVGRKASETDEAGNVTRFGYDKLGRLTQVTDALGGITQYGYDELGNKVSQTDAKGNVTRWEYDALGRITKRTLPEGMAETFTYDAVGNLASHTDFNAATTRYTYDAMNRQTGRTFAVTNAAGATADTTVSTTYTVTGQVATITDATGTTTHTYDNRDRLTQVENPDGGVVEYTYDLAGNRTSVSSRYGPETPKVVSYEYDALNRLSKVTTSANLGSEVTTYGYDAVGNLKTQGRANGTTDRYTYDARNRLIQIDTVKTADESLLARFTYTLTAHGLRSGVMETINTSPAQTRTVTYSYDQLKRLTGQQTGAASAGLGFDASYQYDAVGNRTSATEGGVTTTYGYDKNDRLKTESRAGISVTYAYDLNGNQTGRTETQGGTTIAAVYGWRKSGIPGEDRLVRFTPDTNQGSANSVSFVYDAEGNRILKAKGLDPTAAANADVTRFLVDKNKPYADVLEERDGGKQLLAYYAFGHRLLAQTRYTGTTATTSQMHQDGLGSTRLMTTNAAGIANSYVYKPYGETLAQTGALANNFLFAGEQFDANLKLYYNRARYLNTQLGRFVSADPLVSKGSRPVVLNKYTYANLNPTRLRDPSGKLGLGEIGMAISTGLLISQVSEVVARNFVFGRRDHFYEIDNEICNLSDGCSADSVFRTMEYFPAPLWIINDELDAPVKTGQQGFAGAFFPGGVVTFRVIPVERKIINITTPFHALCCGTITRYAYTRGSTVRVNTKGEGDNHTAFLAWANEMYGRRVFAGLDEELRENWFKFKLPRR